MRRSQITFGLVLLLALARAAMAAELTGRASVTDGDMIEIRGQHVRLHGIDAPESGQWCADGTGNPYRCGQRAAFALADRIGAGNVRCQALDVDRYGRAVARCFHGAADLNAWMVQQGWALAYRQFSTEYVPHESEARQHRRGVWKGPFDPPGKWRRGPRTVIPTGVAATDLPDASGCTIKGNVSSSGEHIYHVPGQQHDDQTVISPEKGERGSVRKARRGRQVGGARRFRPESPRPSNLAGTLIRSHR